MPCKICEEIYRNLPCNNIIDSDTILNEGSYSKLGSEGTRKTVSIYNLLSGYCPCKLCLVRVMCNEPCEEFEYRVRI